MSSYHIFQKYFQMNYEKLCTHNILIHNHHNYMILSNNNKRIEIQNGYNPDITLPKMANKLLDEIIFHLFEIFYILHR